MVVFRNSVFWRLAFWTAIYCFLIFFLLHFGFGWERRRCLVYRWYDVDHFFFSGWLFSFLSSRWTIFWRSLFFPYVFISRLIWNSIHRLIFFVDWCCSCSGLCCPWRRDVVARCLFCCLFCILCLCFSLFSYGVSVQYYYYYDVRMKSEKRRMKFFVW